MNNSFIDRELSWCQFNTRVLLQVTDVKTPILEKLMFLSIYGSNLDEFFMVRIGSLSDQNLLFPKKEDEKTGLTAKQSINGVFEYLKQQEKNVSKVVKKLHQNLAKEGVEILDINQLSDVDEIICKQKLNDIIRPVISFQIVDKHHPFPFIANKESVLVAHLISKDKKAILGLISLRYLPKYISFQVNGIEKICFCDQLLIHFIDEIFKKYQVIDCATIRITRNADIDLNSDVMDENENYLSIVEKLLKKRKRLQIVRIQTSKILNSFLLSSLINHLKVKESVFIHENYQLDLSYALSLKKDLVNFIDNGTYKSVTPVISADFINNDAFLILDKQDVLLSYPYQSSSIFIQLLYQAASNPNVKSIKITLYRLANTSRIASALSLAAEKGKEVVCYMELRARFDEQSNIDYAKILADAGCIVQYGLPRYKVHSKLCLITYQQDNITKYYSYVGTGNFNEKTQEQYTDLAILTSHQGIGCDVLSVFDALSLNETVPNSNFLWVAPNYYRHQLISLIEEEIKFAKNNQPAEIILKINSLNDLFVMNKLREAADAGVKVNLICRGICCLKANHPNLKIKSILGRYLEHSRIFCFGVGDRAKFYIGSGDLLNRNTQRRVEVFISVLDNNIVQQLKEILNVELSDNSVGYIMLEDGSYQCNNAYLHSQDILREYFSNQLVVNINSKISFLKKIFYKIFKRSK